MTPAIARDGDNSATPLLRCDALSCTRDGRSLFHDLELTLMPGEACELLGANGTGKSTLLRCIAGLFPDYQGRVTATSVHYFGHRLALNNLLSANANLAWYAALAGRDFSAADAEQVLQQVGLPGYGPMPVAQLSAGQQRRVALARLQIVPASLWLLDEPYTALDTHGQQLVNGLLEQHLAAGGALLCATHQPVRLASIRQLRLGVPG